MSGLKNPTCWKNDNWSFFGCRFSVTTRQLQHNFPLSSTCFGCPGWKDNQNFKHCPRVCRLFHCCFHHALWSVFLDIMLNSFQPCPFISSTADEWFNWSTINPRLEYTKDLYCKNREVGGSRVRPAFLIKIFGLWIQSGPAYRFHKYS